MCCYSVSERNTCIDQRWRNIRASRPAVNGPLSTSEERMTPACDTLKLSATAYQQLLWAVPRSADTGLAMHTNAGDNHKTQRCRGLSQRCCCCKSCTLSQAGKNAGEGVLM